jgi:IclR family acetate operon transcriptional repressor
MGRCLLAWLPERQRAEALWEAAKAGAPRNDTAGQEEVLAQVRAQGFAVLGDASPNVCTVAAPIWGSGRRVVGALGIGGPTTRFPVERASSLAPRLMEVGAAISGRYGTTSSVLNERDGA